MLTAAALSETIPVIETERLILREPQDQDFDAIVRFAASDRTQFVGGKQSSWEAWRGHLATIGHWVTRGYGMWIVEDRETGQPAGRVGFLNHVGWQEPELGWQVFEGFEGRGIAYEAALAAREAGARHFGLNGVISYIHRDNIRSLKLAARLGATVESEGELLGNPVLIHRHPKVLA